MSSDEPNDAATQALKEAAKSEHILRTANNMLVLFSFLLWYREAKGPSVTWGGNTLQEAIEAAVGLMGIKPEDRILLENTILGKEKKNDPTDNQA